MMRHRVLALAFISGLGVGAFSANGLQALWTTSPIVASAQTAIPTKLEFAKTEWQLLKPFERAINSEESQILMVAPTLSNPLPSGRLDDLPGKIVGFVYVTTRVARLALEPGRYGVRVESVSGTTAKVEFLDSQEKIVSRAPATVQETLPTQKPMASFDSSFCYVFDRKRICI